MADKFLSVTDNKGSVLQKRLVDCGDGTYAEKVAAGADVIQSVPDFRTSTDLLTAYGNFSEVHGEDFVARVRYSNGQAVTALSADPITPGESRMMLNVPVYQPCALEVEASVVRNRQQFTTLTLFSNGEDGLPAPVPNPINIVSIYQSSADSGSAYNSTAGTIVTVNLETALPDPAFSAAGVYLSDWVHIDGLVDSRLNYQNACIKYISPDRKQVTFGFSDDASLPSLAIATVTPTLGTAKMHFYNNMGGAAEGFGLRFSGTVDTSAAVVSVLGNGDAQVSSTLFGDHRISIASSARNILNGVFGNVEMKATSRYRLEGRPNEAAVLDKPIEGSATVFTARVARTAVKPAVHLPLYPRIRVFQPVGMSRPTDKITAISKSGTTTATVTHTGTRTYQVGEVVGIYGVRDIANFPQASVTITAVLSSTQFQLVVGSAVTATSYGGTVSIINGGAAQPGIIGQNAQTVRQYNLNTEWLEVIGNTTWAGVAIGDYINLYGVCDAAGVNLGVDGAWEVAHLSTTSLLLKPVYDLFGVRRSPAMPALGTVALNCGGSVILRTTARVHDLILEEWSENKVMIDGQGTNRSDKALPVWPATTFTVAGSTAIDGALSPTGGAMPVAYRAQTSNPTAVSASGDAVYPLATMLGAVVEKPYCIPEVEWNYTGALTATTDVAAKAAAGAGLKNHVTMMQATNTGATANDVLLRDGTTTRLQVTIPAGQSVVMPLPTGLQLTANTALNVALSAAGTVRVNLTGYTAP